MTGFNALSMFRTIAQDNSLRTVQKAALWSAIFYTDNGTGKVRASQALIAERAGLAVRTVERVMKNETVTDRYFAKVERGRRGGRAYVDAWWKPTSDVGDHRTESQVPPDRESGSTRQSVRTSTSHYDSSTSLPQIPSAAPCFDHGVIGCGCSVQEEIERGVESPAPIELCQLHASFPADACIHCIQPRVESNAPEWQQRQWRGRELEAEGLDPNGEPIADDEISSRYQRRPSRSR